MSLAPQQKRYIYGTALIHHFNLAQFIIYFPTGILEYILNKHNTYTNLNEMIDL